MKSTRWKGERESQEDRTCVKAQAVTENTMLNVNKTCQVRKIGGESTGNK